MSTENSILIKNIYYMLAYAYKALYREGFEKTGTENFEHMEPFEVEELGNDDFTNGVWSERVLVITQDYEIKGYVFMPKIGKRSRVLSDILNGKKRFVAIKDCEVAYRQLPNRRTEFHDFVQLNINSIIILRPTCSEE